MATKLGLSATPAGDNTFSPKAEAVVAAPQGTLFVVQLDVETKEEVQLDTELKEEVQLDTGNTLETQLNDA